MTEPTLAQAPADERSCPFCAESIKPAAIVCKHCGRDIPAMKLPPDADIALMGALGISFDDGRYQWRGNTFKRFEDAASYARVHEGQAQHTPAPPGSSGSVNWWLWAPAGAVGAFIIWALVRTPSPQETERYRAQDVIEYCWREQSRKSLDPAAVRFAASACEKLAEDYRAKYGRNP